MNYKKPSEIAIHVEQYVARHTRAADTVRGIRQWWLPSELRSVSDKSVERALEILIANGTLERVRLDSGTVIYRSVRRPDEQ